MQPTLLIIDDEHLIRKVLRHHFERKGYRVLEASTASEGLHLVREETPDVILLDLKLPDLDGLTALDRIKEIQPESAVIVLTAHGTYEKAVEAVKRGAEDFLIKEPAEGNLAAMELRVLKAVERLRKDRIRSYYRQHFRRRSTDREPAIPGEHSSIHALNNLVDLMAQNPSTTVLLLGESGTGKELIAKAIHQKSIRRDKPFVEINCAGLSENLLDSELFGHERGAFTDAKTTKRGLLEVADGGSVLLDEIGDMPAPVQPKLLRVLETQTFRRVGGLRDITVDVRTITATNRDLMKLVESGRFREDLYYRLKVMPVEIPPLRERGHDVLFLAQLFVQDFNTLLKKRIRGFSEQAQKILLPYAWPGNVRELKNVTERAMILCPGDVILPEHLPADLQRLAGKHVRVIPEPAVTQRPHRRASDQFISLSEFEKDYIREALEATGGNRTQTAKLLGISRSTLLDKIKRYRLKG
ncbi:MAG: sigma-54-dependent transcriptional regulator [Candidatus Methylomirabilales bacterium]|nr:sigma-54-dependent Fis family transcriptional regulator [candidate division NC10 bacterium]MCZ6551286.1 sigma-54 dependent transcriptional regulator [candidate division NC10 bacterium]